MKYIYFIFLSLGACLQAIQEDECSKDSLLSYFPKSFLNETLKKYNIPEEQWEKIYDGLSAKNEEILKIVQEKNEKLHGESLQNPLQRKAVIAIFRETLFQVFSEVLNKQEIYDPKLIQNMLDDIQLQKAKRFSECLKEDKIHSHK